MVRTVLAAKTQSLDMEDGIRKVDAIWNNEDVCSALPSCAADCVEDIDEGPGPRINHGAESKKDGSSLFQHRRDVSNLMSIFARKEIAFVKERKDIC